MFINLVSEAFTFFFCRSSCGTFVMINRCFPIHYFFNQLLGFVNTIRNFYFQQWLSVKTGHFHIFICRDNDTITGSNFFIGQNIFCSAGTVSFRFYRNSKFLSFFFQGFRCHISMGNSCRTGGYGKNTITGSCF